MMTKLITIPKFAAATGLPYRLCLHLIGTGQIPSVAVGRRRRIDVRWVEQWLATGGYRPDRGRGCATGVEREHQVNREMLTTAE
jgi:excisionase family DNA binding protein